MSVGWVFGSDGSVYSIAKDTVLFLQIIIKIRLCCKISVVSTKIKQMNGDSSIAIWVMVDLEGAYV